MNKRGYHLLWALPIALVPAYFALVISTIMWCGISGCRGGGFGRIVDPNLVGAVLWLVASAVIAAIPVMVIAWSEKRELRFMTALSYASLVGLIGLALIAPW